MKATAGGVDIGKYYELIPPSLGKASGSCMMLLEKRNHKAAGKEEI